MTAPAPSGTGTLTEALAQLRQLVGTRPAVAEAQARAILSHAPGQAEAQRLLGVAQRRQGRTADAIATLSALVRSRPRDAAGWLELGLAQAAAGAVGEAIGTLRRAVRVDGDLFGAWLALGDLLGASGDVAAAAEAYQSYVQTAVGDPALRDAAAALADGRLAEAEPILRAQLKAHPTDVAAMRMLGELGTRLGRYGDAERLLARAVELVPGWAVARFNLATVLYRQNKTREALAEIAQLLAAEPRHPGYRNLKAAALGKIGEYAEAAALYRSVLDDHPDQAKVWMSYGHALKTIGRQADAVDAYRAALARAPAFGEVWWSLANLKTVSFAADDLAAMRAALDGEGLSDEDRFHLHFALAKALEDAGAFEESYRHYAEGNRLRRPLIQYQADETTDEVDRSVRLFTPAFLQARAGQGHGAADPIFILGMPRSGSTLVEQILSSHSQVEGTMELPDIPAMARRLNERKKRGEQGLYPEVLATLDAATLDALGREYLERTRIQRKTAKPFFIDKMPNNWAHAGFIHLILPNARIIDTRRDPVSCCFSNFKQHFARGQGFSYAFDDLARYYRDYVRLMAHLDEVLPGRIHRVDYETMVADTEGEVRRLLDHLELPFEEPCLRFWQSDRAVRTASSEQVRQPINRSGVEVVGHFDPWLGELRAALGDLAA